MSRPMQLVVVMFLGLIVGVVARLLIGRDPLLGALVAVVGTCIVWWIGRS